MNDSDPDLKEPAISINEEPQPLSPSLSEVAVAVVQAIDKIRIQVTKEGVTRIKTAKDRCIGE